MDYKDKLVELATKCLNDESLYNKTIDQVDPYRSTPQVVAYTKVAPITCGNYDNYYSSRTTFFLNNVKYSSVSKLTKDYSLVDSYKTFDNKMISELKVNFEDLPPLVLFYESEKKEEIENINIPYRKFFKPIEQYVIKTTTIYTSYYSIKHGSLKARLTIEEAQALFDLYLANDKKFKEKSDLAKLESRLLKYNQ